MTTNTTPGADALRHALEIAEAALADIRDADREPGDDVAWCEARAAEALPTVRAALVSAAPQPVVQQGELIGWIKSSEIDSAKRMGGSINLWLNKYDCDTPLYTHPAAPVAQGDAEDAARYRLLRRGQRWSVIDGIGNDLRAEALDAAVDAARAARAPADSVTAAAGCNNIHGMAEQALAKLKSHIGHVASNRGHWETRHLKDALFDLEWIVRRKLTAAQAADSVLEDAARLDWLEGQSQVNIERVRYLGADTSIYEVTPFNSTDYNGETLRKAIDAARSQAKEGA